MRRKTAPYGGMQNGSYGEKENGNDSKAKDTIVQTEEDMLSKRFRQDVTRILGGEHGLPDESNKTAKMLRKTAKTVLGLKASRENCSTVTLCNKI